ncbi:MAG: hypothetical protein AAF944_26385 [Bacteroidota bacterium]
MREIIQHFKKFISDYTDASDDFLAEISRLTKPRRVKSGSTSYAGVKPTENLR